MVLGGTIEGYVGAFVARTFFLDPKTEKWTSGPNMLQPRDEETATLLPDGSVLVTGGWTPGHSWQGGPSTTTERCIPAENRFVADAPMPVVKAGHHALWVAGQRGKQLLILGGDSRDWISNRIVLDYDVATGVWHKAGTTSTGPYGPDGTDISPPCGTTLINGQVFLWDNLVGDPHLWPLTLPAANETAPQGAIRVAAPKGMGSPAGYRNQIDKEYLLGVAVMNPEQLTWLVSQGADVNTRDDQGNTLLILALQHGADLKSVQMMIAHGADINAKNAEGLTPLMLASQYGRKNCVQELLSRNADVNSRNQSGQTALFLALQQDRADVPPLLMEKNADVNLASSDGITPLMLAASKGHAALVKELINHGADVNATTPYGLTALREAAQHGHREVVQELLAAGADR